MVRVVIAAGHSTSFLVSKLSFASAASAGSAPETLTPRLCETCLGSQLDCSCNPAEQPAAADRRYHHVDIRQLFNDLHAAGRLAGNDIVDGDKAG